MSEPVGQIAGGLIRTKDVDTDVQVVWELLLEDGTVYTWNEEPTAEAAIAKAQSDLAKSIAMHERFVARYGPVEDLPDYSDVKFVKVRRRTSITVTAHLTEYSDEQAITECDETAGRTNA